MNRITALLAALAVMAAPTAAEARTAHPRPTANVCQYPAFWYTYDCLHRVGHPLPDPTKRHVLPIAPPMHP